MNFLPETIYWQAHRGGGGIEAPDNTICAMKYGWSLGGIPEADIRVTADREIVCQHDNTLRRTTDAPDDIADLPVGKLTLAEIKKYDAGRKFDEKFAGEKVPALREVFEIMRQDREKMIYADIKNYDAELFPVLLEKFSGLVQEYDTATQIIAAGCDYELNCRLHENIPGIKTMQWIGGTPEQRMLKFRELADKDFAGLDMVQLHLRPVGKTGDNWMYDLPIEDIKYAYSILGARLEVFPFGAFTPEAIQTLLGIGIKHYATDEPVRFSQILKRSGVNQRNEK
ncbi:MAG: glycerophosphodiester phosphodiesterase [Lentisphaeria bacterium]|nr:glycerophosphodiester phosphodiesterase [Lentisphaeria bacterium]